MMAMLKNFLNRNSGKIAIFYSILLFVILVMPMPKIPSQAPDLQVDKIIHFLLFFLYFVILMKSLEEYNHVIIKSMIISLCFALVTESLQSLLPHRSGSLGDFLADSAGILVGLVLKRSKLSNPD